MVNILYKTNLCNMCEYLLSYEKTGGEAWKEANRGEGVKKLIDEKQG